MNPDHILVVSITRFPGLVWDAKAKKVVLQYLGSYINAGAGYAMLSMAWPSEAFRVRECGKREYLSGSVFQALMAANVDYIYSSFMADYETLNPATSTLDLAFLAPAIYMMQSHHDANMAMEVTQSTSDSLLRQQGALVLSPSAQSVFSCALTRTDLHTQSTRALVERAVANYSGGMTSSTGRYVMKVKEIAKLIRGPTSFRPDIKISVDSTSGQVSAYLNLDIADLTSCISSAESNQVVSRCVAILGKTCGRDPGEIIVLDI
jgi:hypothetical protein